MTKGISKRKKQIVFAKTKGKCFYCGIPLLSEQFCVDHIVAKITGGGNCEANLVPSCRSCNSSKGSKSLEQYRLWLQYYAICKPQGFSIFQLEWLLSNTNFAIQFPMESPVFYGETLGGSCE